MSNNDYLVCHYHRVDALLWLEIRSWLQKVMKERVLQGHDRPSVFVSKSMWESIDDFVCQMECAYLHPRRDSFHVKRCLVNYAGRSRESALQPSRLSSRALHRQSGVSAIIATKKNLKSGRKEVWE
jgi:hypothetical protein